MRKNRNRSVKNSFEFPVSFLESLPNTETVQANLKASETCQGDKIFQSSDKIKRKLKQKSTFSYNQDSLTNESDLDIVSFDKSSSSSISWSDDFDAEATKQVQCEFERMERILQGRETIPLHYNKDEYKLWINTFPQLSVIGHNIEPSSINGKDVNDYDKQEEVIAYHSDYVYTTSHCDTLSSADLKKIACIKDQAVEKVFKKRSNNLVNDSNANATELVENTKTTTKSQALKLSSSNSNTSSRLTKTLTPNERQQSSSTMSSKWIHEPSAAYSSLPYINSAKKTNSKPLVRKKSSSNSRYSSNASSYRSNYVSLPPIKTLNTSSLNQHGLVATQLNSNLLSTSITAQNRNGKKFEINKKLHGRKPN